MIIYLIITFYFAGIDCAHQRISDSLDISVNEIQITSWVNLMPGGPGSFHLSGEIQLTNNESYGVRKLSLINISLKQLDRQLYSFSPIFNPKIENDNTDIPEKAEKNFIFYTQSGLSISKELNFDLPVKVLMTFKEENYNYFHYEIENIKVEKVY